MHHRAISRSLQPHHSSAVQESHHEARWNPSNAVTWSRYGCGPVYGSGRTRTVLSNHSNQLQLLSCFTILTAQTTMQSCSRADPPAWPQHSTPHLAQRMLGSVRTNAAPSHKAPTCPAVPLVVFSAPTAALTDQQPNIHVCCRAATAPLTRLRKSEKEEKHFPYSLKLSSCSPQLPQGLSWHQTKNND